MIKLNLSKYWRDLIDDYPALDRKQNEVLFKKLLKSKNATKKRKIREQLILGNLKIGLSQLYRSKEITSIDHDDILVETFLGLIYAIDRFDITKGNALSTYASNQIKHEVNRLMSELSTIVKFPSSVTETLIKNRLIECGGSIERMKEKYPQYMKQPDKLINLYVSYDPSPIDDDKNNNHTEDIPYNDIQDDTLLPVLSQLLNNNKNKIDPCLLKSISFCIGNGNGDEYDSNK